MVAERALHDVMEDLLHFELAGGLQIGARTAHLGEHGAIAIGEQTDGLRTARIDSEYMHASRPVEQRKGVSAIMVQSRQAR